MTGVRRCVVWHLGLFGAVLLVGSCADRGASTEELRGKARVSLASSKPDEIWLVRLDGGQEPKRPAAVPRTARLEAVPTASASVPQRGPSSGSGSEERARGQPLVIRQAFTESVAMAPASAGQASTQEDDSTAARPPDTARSTAPVLGTVMVTCPTLPQTPFTDCACPEGSTVVGGGGYAPGPLVLKESRPVGPTVWRLACQNREGYQVACADGTAGSVWIICAQVD